MKRFVLLVFGRQQCSVSCCLLSEPSGMPAGVWARSVSASEIEVNWQALSFSPERVLGYEVHFTLLNGNRNHTQHNSNGCHWPCRTWEPSLPAKIIQFFVPTRQQNISKWCQENKESCLSTRLFVSLLVMGHHAAKLHLCYTAAPDFVSTCNTKNCDDAKIHSLLTSQQYHHRKCSTGLSHHSQNKIVVSNNYILNAKQ